MRGGVLFLAFGLWVGLTSAAAAQVTKEPEVPPAALCDALAASPDDENRPAGVVGVDIADIDAARAIPACQQALVEHPGDLRLTFQLARALEKTSGNDEEAFRLYRSIAEQGYAPAQTYLHLLETDNQDYRQTKRQFERAAKKGDADAQTNLGIMHQQGLGVPQDYKEARRWYERAASQGESWAQTYLGILYEEGLGVPQDYREARRWYELAAKREVGIAQHRIGLMYKEGRGVPQDYHQALYWFELTARRNAYANAQYDLGILYEEGLGVPQDDKQARHWYERAADQDYTPAQDKLKKMNAQ